MLWDSRASSAASYRAVQHQDPMEVPSSLSCGSVASARASYKVYYSANTCAGRTIRSTYCATTMARVTDVRIMNDMEGNYSKLNDAEFNNITVNTERADGTIEQLVLPPNRQGSVYRADLEDIAFRMGDTDAEG